MMHETERTPDRAESGPKLASTDDSAQGRARGIGVVAFALAIVAVGMLPRNIVAAMTLLRVGAPIAAAAGVLFVAFPLVMLVGAVGLWFRRAWARPIVLTVVVISVAFLLTILISTPMGIEWFLPLVHFFAASSVLLYLRKRHVRESLT